MDNGVDTFSPQVYWEAYEAVIKIMGRETYQTEEDFLKVVREWAQFQQEYLNNLKIENGINNN